MLWILLALLGAVTNAAYFIIVKMYIATVDPRILTGIGFTLGGCLLFAVSALIGFPVIGPEFFPAVAITVILNILGLNLIFRALSSSDLSLSVPMLSFTPAILIGTSYVILHEVPSLPGFFGICIIVSGSYVLNISAEHEHFLDPVRAMMRNRGSWYMLIVAFLFATSINFDKIAMLNSDPFFSTALSVMSIGIAFLLISAYSQKAGRKRHTDLFAHTMTPGGPPKLTELPEISGPPARVFALKQFAGLSLLIGIFVSIEAASVTVAYTLQIVPYVIAIKRLSIIFMVLYGTIVFYEGELGKRVMGAAIMVAGAVIILLFS
jgi:drug/metabolite transporter (DMT)-like permease